MIINVYVSNGGAGLSLNEEPYKLAGGSFENESVTHRITEVTSPFVEGTFVVNSLRENVTVPLGVWVKSTTWVDLKTAIRSLCAAFDQVQFTTTVVIDGHSQLWNCYASDYSVNITREYLHDYRAKVDINLVRDPNEEVS